MRPMPTNTRASTLMNLIDIASWQRGIDLQSLFAKTPLDGVIVKATQGLTYVNPDYAAWTKWLSDHDKPFGVYHYLDLYGAEEEARHFVETVKPYIGKATLTADYEGNTIRKGTVYLKAFLDEVYRLTGVKAFVYVSQSYIATGGFGEIANAGYPLWLAQYASSTEIVNGFRDNPWQKGSVSPFPKIWMHQYTSCGRLAGWKDNLDLDQFKGSYSAWLELARGEDAPPAPAPPALKPADPTVVLAVLKNEYGTEASTPTRSTRLRAAGYDPESVQKKINQLYETSAKLKQDIGNDMPYINALLWIVRSI